VSEQFVWLNEETVHKEIRRSKHGEELRWLVNRETIRNEATGEMVTRSHLRHPGICVMVPFTDDGKILLMNQYRYAANEYLWELSAGTLEGKEVQGRMQSDESPDECAKRELLEETGYEAASWEKVCECYAMPGASDELMHIFFARALTLREQSLDVGEVIAEIRAFSRDELKAMIERGEIRDAKTLVGLFYAFNDSKW
jgi:ADP-ribose pyrophosphatase